MDHYGGGLAAVVAVGAGRLRELAAAVVVAGRNLGGLGIGKRAFDIAVFAGTIVAFSEILAGIVPVVVAAFGICRSG